MTAAEVLKLKVGGEWGEISALRIYKTTFPVFLAVDERT